MSGKHALVWFRRDLRLADNPALLAATAWARANGGGLIPLYLADVGEGEWADGGASRWWLHHTLVDLDTSLRGLGSGLCVRVGEPLEMLQRLAAQAEVGAVFWNRQYEPAAIARDKRIKAALQADGQHVASSNGSLLTEPWEVMTRAGGPYKVFTPFSRAQRVLDFPAPQAAPQDLPPLPAGLDGVSIDDLGLLPTIAWDSGIRAAWTPGEHDAQHALDEFAAEAVTAYGGARDLPAQAGTSRLSPALHFGEISPRQAWHAALGAAGEGAEPWLRQLQWRDFGHHLLFHFPHTPTEPLNAAFAAFPWRADYADDLRAWQQGRTGIPIIDAGMRELWHTGWMHNRVRMLVASLLTKNLLIPWQEGARWFWDTLVDADLANNTLGWQWTAGCGADAAPYFRIFNPVTQGEKFDPGGHYVRRWVSELGRLPDRWIHRPWEAPATVLRGAGLRLGQDDYPHPIVDLAKSRRIALDIWANEVRGGP